MLFELVLIGIVVVVVLSIVYSTVRLGISPMPSSAKAYQAMMSLVDDTSDGLIIDLGSGWGNFVIPLAKRYPQRPIIGYELSLLPWLVSVLLKYSLGLKNLTLYRQDFLKADLAGASVLVCYLYPEAMKKIESKLLLEKPDVGVLISNNFALPGWKVDRVIQINDFYKSPIYRYKISSKPFPQKVTDSSN